mgnify:CR=1 FL=1
MNNVRFIAYLGPPGTFSEEAALPLSKETNAAMIPQPDIKNLLERVSGDEECIGVLPIENSVHGEVTMAWDSLIFQSKDIYIIREVVVPITFCSFRKSGRSTTGIHTIISHPHALAQCGNYLRSLNVSVKAASSTAEACRIVAQEDDSGTLAIASERAGLMYNLAKIDCNIDDHKGSATRFYVIGHNFPASSGSDKTVIAAIPSKEGKGVLIDLLGSISHRDLDIYSIHSRSLPAFLGKYCFVIIFEGHIKDLKTIALLNEMVSRRITIKILGTFPSWKGEYPSVRFSDMPGGIYELKELHTILK